MEKYKGKILISKVQLVLADPRMIVVHSLGLGEDQFVYCSNSGFEKALRALKIIGQHGVVMIEYVFTEPVKGVDLDMPGMCMRLVDIKIE